MKLINPTVKYLNGGVVSTQINYDTIKIDLGEVHIEDSSIQEGYDYGKDYPDAFAQDLTESFLLNFALKQMQSNTGVDLVITGKYFDVGSLAGLFNAFRQVTIERCKTVYISNDVVLSTFRAQSMKFDTCNVVFQDKRLVEMNSVEFFNCTIQCDKTVFICKEFKAVDSTFVFSDTSQFNFVGSRTFDESSLKFVGVLFANVSKTPSQKINLRSLMKISNFKKVSISAIQLKDVGNRVSIFVESAIKASIDDIALLSSSPFIAKCKLACFETIHEVVVSNVSYGSNIKPKEGALFFISKMTYEMIVRATSVNVVNATLFDINGEINKLIVSKSSARAVVVIPHKIGLIDISDSTFWSLDNGVYSTKANLDGYEPRLATINIEKCKFMSRDTPMSLEGGTINLIRSEFRSRNLQLIGYITLDNTIIRSDTLRILGKQLDAYGAYLRGIDLFIKVERSNIQGSDKKYERTSTEMGTMRGAWISIKDAMKPISS